MNGIRACLWRPGLHRDGDASMHLEQLRGQNANYLLVLGEN